MKPRPADVESIYAEVMRLAPVDLAAAARQARRAERLASSMGDRRAHALALRAKANVEFLRDRLIPAAALYEEALQQFERAGDAIEAARTRNSALVTLIYLSRFEQARDWAERARAVFIQAGDELRLARLEGNIATLLFRQDRFREAYELYDRVHQVMEKHGSLPDIAAALRNKATCLISLADFEAAFLAHRAARDFCAAHHMPVLVSGADYNAAYLHYLSGDFVNAARAFAQARHASSPYLAALCDLDESEMYLELNLHREAAYLARRAVRKFRALSMPYEEGKAATFFALAEGQLGRMPAAMTWLRRARAIFEAQGNLVWQALIDLYSAFLLASAGRLGPAAHLAEAAQRYFDGSPFLGKAVAAELLLARLELQQHHPEAALARCRTIRVRAALTASPSLRGQAAQLSAEAAEACGDLTQAALFFQEARDWYERLRFRLRGDEMKVAFLRDKRTVYEAVVAMALRDGAGPDAPARAFSLAEDAKSRAMSEFACAPEPVSELENRDLSRLREYLDALYLHLDRLAAEGTPHSIETWQAVRAKATQAEAELSALLTSTRALRSPQSGVLAGDVAGEALASLPPGTQLVEYFEIRGRLVVFLSAQGRLSVHELGPMHEILRVLRFLRFQIMNSAPGAPSTHAPVHRILHEHLQRLYQLLVAPIREKLTGPRLLVVPHGELHSLPFHGLFDGSHYLADLFTVFYTPSARLWLSGRALPPLPSPATSLILGVAGAEAPHVAREVRLLAGLLPGSLLFENEAASLEVLHKHGPEARLIHIAGHGSFQRINPLFSGIRLGRSRLTVYDLYQMRLRAELVFLSGCSTGLNEVTGADELVGLLRGLFHAGARSALVSLWDIHDSTAVLFSQYFYSRWLLQGDSIEEACRGAALQLRNQFEEPFHWAAYALIGRMHP